MKNLFLYFSFLSKILQSNQGNQNVRLNFTLCLNLTPKVFQAGALAQWLWEGLLFCWLWVRIPALFNIWTFFTLFVVNFVMLVRKRSKINEKEAGKSLQDRLQDLYRQKVSFALAKFNCGLMPKFPVFSQRCKFSFQVFFKSRWRWSV